MKYFRKFLCWLVSTRVYDFVIKSVIPYVRFTFYYPKFNGFQFGEARQLLRDGDIILCKDNKKLTTFLIGGEWSHAALCVDWLSDEILEMDHTGFHHGTFFDLCKQSDEICILRCEDWDEWYCGQVIAQAWALRSKGVGYDGEFKLGVEALYCSELIYQADFERRLCVNLDDLVGLGREYISPTGLYNAGKCGRWYCSGPSG